MSENPTDINELFEIVRDDLLFLRKEWNSQISDSNLRRSSNVLRNLLTYDLIGKASRHLKIEFYIKTTAIDTHKLFEMIPADDLLLYMAGGALHNGAEVVNVIHLFRPFIHDEGARWAELSNPEKSSRLVKIDSYKSLPSLIIRDRIITKNDIIQYIANKKGGTHFDSKRNDSVKEVSYKEIDRIFEIYKFADKKIAYFELLSIGQELSKSDSVDSLLKEISKAL